MPRRSNIILIGMPGVGKSTVGVLLAKATSRDFIDTDVVIQVREQRRLQAILDETGIDAFRALEERHICSIRCANHVVATGGSVVYSAKAMRHLRKGGTVVHLFLPYPFLERRITDLKTRGVVMAKGQTLKMLFNERMPLYQRYADASVNCAKKTPQQVLDAVLKACGNGFNAKAQGRKAAKNS